MIRFSKLNEARDKSVPTEWRIAKGKIERLIDPKTNPTQKELGDWAKDVAKDAKIKDVKQFIRWIESQISFKIEKGVRIKNGKPVKEAANKKFDASDIQKLGFKFVKSGFGVDIYADKYDNQIMVGPDDIEYDIGDKTIMKKVTKLNLKPISESEDEKCPECDSKMTIVDEKMVCEKCSKDKVEESEDDLDEAIKDSKALERLLVMIEKGDMKKAAKLTNSLIRLANNKH